MKVPLKASPNDKKRERERKKRELKRERELETNRLINSIVERQLCRVREREYDEKIKILMSYERERENDQTVLRSLH